MVQALERSRLRFSRRGLFERNRLRRGTRERSQLTVDEGVPVGNLDAEAVGRAVPPDWVRSDDDGRPRR